MKTQNLCSAVLIGAALAIGLALPAHAQSNEDRLRDQLRKTTLDLRQLQDENAQLKTQLDAASAAAASAAKKPVEDVQVGKLRRSQQAQAAQIDALRQQLDEAKAALAKSQASYDEIRKTAAGSDAESKKYLADFQETRVQLHNCRSDNVNLVAISNILLERYKNKGVWDAMRDQEPLTGLHRLKLEKAAQEYHGQIVDATVVIPLEESHENKPSP